MPRAALRMAAMVCTWGLVASTSLAVAPAQSHGPAPSPLSVFHVDSESPQAIGMSIGLARATEAGFEYVCPTAWQQTGETAFDRPIPVAAAVGDTLVVAGTPDLMRGNNNGCGLVPVDGDLRGRGAAVVDVTAVGDGFFVLVDDGIEGTSVWQAPTSDADFERVVPATVPLQSAAHGAEFFVAAGVDRREEERALVVLQPNPDGTDYDVTRLIADDLPPGAATLSSVRVRLVDDAGIWLVVGTAMGFHLWRMNVDGTTEEVVQSEGAIHGPIALCGGVAFAVDGILEFVDAAPSCSLAPVSSLNVRCLGQTGGLPFACADFQLHSLTEQDGAVVNGVIFRMTELLGPDLTCVDGDDAKDRCTAVWTHFGAEAGLVEPESEPDPSPTPEPTTCGCSTSTPTGPTLALACLLALGCFVVRRRTPR